MSNLKLNVEGLLSNQVYIYSLSTNSFFSDAEHELHKKKQGLEFAKSGHLKQLKKLGKKKDDSIKEMNKQIKELKEQLNTLLDNFSGIRTIREVEINDKNIIAQFESALTRKLTIVDEKTTDIIMVRTYHYSVLKSLVTNGFQYGEDKYTYFTSSAGNIRNKKSVFIKQKVFNEIKNSLFAGLTVEKINEQGGMNVNKWNAYQSLSMSASIPFEGFDIDRCIVVDDLETKVDGEVDHIDSDTYKIDRVYKKTPVVHTDGAGICLPTLSDKAFQIRMPFFKGLIVSCPFTKFIKNHKDANPIVKDIYGKEWNVIEEDIQIIFTKSQFKAWKYFSTWDEYKKAFKKYGCEASIASTEQDEHNDKTLNYQMLQTLTDMTTDELTTIASQTVDSINKMGNDLDTMLIQLGAKDNENMNRFQEAISIYTQLLNDSHTQKAIRETRRSMIKRANSGKLLLEGNKRTFIAPDVYAFCQYLFLGDNNPSGLLEEGEVSCRLYDNGQELDVLRSPHLYLEHAVKDNMINDKTKDYFVTDCIYTSVKDMISKVLMFDVDGDEALIVSNPTFINIAKRNMKNIVPLSYKLATAEAEQITNESIYNKLISAYKKNIGEVSNNITKIWNSENVDSEALKVVKWLTFENNATIDYAKTLWMPTRPDDIKATIKEYTKGKVPSFFICAKDKKKDKVEVINGSVVNTLSKDKIVPSSRSHINFEKVIDEFDYTNLLFNKSIDIETNIAKEIIARYDDLNQNKHKEMKKQVKQQGKEMKNVKFYVFKKIREKLREIKNDDIFLTDILVKHLYTNNVKNKDLLWDVFSKVIVWNLKRNVNEVVECLDCGCEIEKTKQRQERCKYCQDKRNKYLARLRKQKQREKKKVTLSLEQKIS